MVILNRDGGTSPATNVAVIDSVGEAYSNAGDKVYTVDFYMNGELKTATTKEDMDDDDKVASAKRGDVFKFTVTGDTITNAKPYLVFNRGTAAKAFVKDSSAIPAIETLATLSANSDEEIYFGAVTKMPKNSSSVTLALADVTRNGDHQITSLEFNNDNQQIIKESNDTHVYVYDPQLRDSNSLDTGSLGDAEIIDDGLVEEGGYKVSGDEIDSGTTTIAYGMLNYVFARYYNNRAADIVVYKNYDFGKFNVEIPEGK